MGSGSIRGLFSQAFVYCFVSVLCIWCLEVCLKLGQWFKSYLSSPNLWPAALCLLCVQVKGEPRMERTYTQRNLFLLPLLPSLLGLFSWFPQPQRAGFSWRLLPRSLLLHSSMTGSCSLGKAREKRETHEHPPSLFSSPQGPLFLLSLVRKTGFLLEI